MRFKRAPSHLLGAKLFGRRDVNARLPIDRALDRGEFLGRLWALFGAPKPRQGGFEFYVRDSETNLDFIAYAGPSGPAYGGTIEQRQQLRRVLEAFEELLDATPPADCSIEYTPEREFGAGTWFMGCRGGRSFDVPDRRGRGAQPPERRALR